MSVGEARGDDERVFNEAGEFEVHDQPVDLSAYRVEDWAAFALFWALALVIFTQFITRYVLNDSAAWTEEIARYLLIGTAFVGAAIGVRKNNHIQVDFAYRYLPRPLARTLATLVDVLRIAFCGYCTWLTGRLIDKIGSSRMSVVDLPMGLVYGVVLAGFALMTWRAVQVARANWVRGESVLEHPELLEEAR